MVIEDMFLRVYSLPFVSVVICVQSVMLCECTCLPYRGGEVHSTSIASSLAVR